MSSENEQQIQLTPDEQRCYESGVYEAFLKVFSLLGIPRPENDAGSSWYFERIKECLELRDKPKIVQILIGPEDAKYQGRLLGLDDQGNVWGAGSEGWELWIQYDKFGKTA